MADLSVNIGKLEMSNPVMTASGTFGYGLEFQDFVDLEKIGGIIVKGTTLHHREGNPYPRMAETPMGMLNAVGLQNKGVHYFVDHIYPQIKDIWTRASNAHVPTVTSKLFSAVNASLPDINSRNAVVRGYAERNAINAPIQGSAADIIKVAMVKIFQRFQSESIRSKMILQVHDELNFSVVPEEKEKVQQIVMEEMEKAYLMQVPLKADCGWGNNWLEAH